MKKSLTLLTLALSASSTIFAASEVPQEPQPILYLSVFDTSSNTYVDLNKLEVSRSSKSQQLCWVASGSFNTKVSSTEVFTSPDKMTFSISKDLGKVTSSQDKKTHIITTTRDALNQGKATQSCWRFDEKDPMGKYTIEVKVDDIQYQPLTFTVTK